MLSLERSACCAGGASAAPPPQAVPLAIHTSEPSALTATEREKNELTITVCLYW
jgi:hypothetical protein